jgi:hypothetical protein
MRVRAVVTTVLAASALAPASAAAADPIMPLTDVRPGMRCSALSVIRGTAPVRFDVEVLDVLRGDPEVIGARILFRAGGEAVAASGIGPGFSGSPIYCPDDAGVERVIGAISEGLGQYGNHVALATPIEQILGVRPVVPAKASSAPHVLRSARPLATPMTVSGLSGLVRQAALAAARRTSTPLLAAPTGPATPYAPYAPTPGTSIAAGLSAGDVALAAIGTVTYRDGDRLWAFGHLLEGAGRRSLPLLDAYVYSVIDNPLGTFDAATYKLATAGRPVGTLSMDGLNAIAGTVGATPPMIPLRVSARDLASGRTSALRVDVADERKLDLGSGLDLIGSFAASQAMANVLGASPPRLTTSMCVRAAVRQRRRPLSFCQRYFDGFGPLDDLSRAFSLLDGFKYGPLGIRGVSVRMKVRSRVREAFILDGDAPLRVRRGQRVRVRMLLQHSRAGRKRVSFPYRIPRSLKPGPHLLTIRGMSGSDGFSGLAGLFAILLIGELGGPGSTPPKSVGELAQRFSALGAREGVRASFVRKRRGPVVYADDNLLIRGKTQIPVIVRKRR